MPDAITAHNLTKKFGTQTALADLSFVLPQGNIMAFLGGNGSGKTTTIRCLLNIYEPDYGHSKILGHEYKPEYSKLVGYLPEERGIYTKVKVTELFDYFGQLHGISKSDRQSFMYQYLDQVDLRGHEHKKVSQLSSGMQQKVQLGVTLMHKPQLLILDEPFKGLDPANRYLFLQLFKQLRAKGTTILYSTHVVDEAEQVADRVLMVKQGQKVLDGSLQEVRQQADTREYKVVTSKPVQPSTHKLFKVLRFDESSLTIQLNEQVDPVDVLKQLIKDDVQVREFTWLQPSLQQLFLRYASDNDK